VRAGAIVGYYPGLKPRPESFSPFGTETPGCKSQNRNSQPHFEPLLQMPEKPIPESRWPENLADRNL
jgi:hypothetical protein